MTTNPESLLGKLRTFSNAATPGPYSAEGFDAIHASVDGLDAGDMILGGDGETIIAQCIMPRDMALILTMLNGLPDIINSLATHPAPLWEGPPYEYGVTWGPRAQPGREEVVWQSIKTAPKGGTWILLFGDLNNEPHARAGFWGEGDDWFDSEAASHSLTCFGWKPTHWAPLHEPQDVRPEAEPVVSWTALPAQIGRLHLGERAADGDGRLCSHGHEITAGHPLYWPQLMGQYDDSDPYCLAHAIERSEDEQGWPTTPPTEPAGLREERLREALEEAEVVLTLVEEPALADPYALIEVRELGDRIGYGNLEYGV